jgi:hypothetical protein
MLFDRLPDLDIAKLLQSVNQLTLKAPQSDLLSSQVLPQLLRLSQHSLLVVNAKPHRVESYLLSLAALARVEDRQRLAHLAVVHGVLAV